MKEQTTLSEISACGEERICATLAAISDARLGSDATSYIPRGNGSTVEVDAIALPQKGLIVIECKVPPWRHHWQHPVIQVDESLSKEGQRPHQAAEEIGEHATTSTALVGAHKHYLSHRLPVPCFGDEKSRPKAA